MKVNFAELNKEYYEITEPTLCARMFEDGTFARCIMFSEYFENSNHIISLEETFDINGGLSKFQQYGAGLKDYRYRKLTNYEITDLATKLSHCDETILGINIWEVINKEIKIVRKIKLQKLKCY